MKSCLGILIIFIALIAVLGGGALIWYLSDTSEFTRRIPPAKVESPGPKPAPRAAPIH